MRRAFTLVELLVVIGIIAVLAGLVLSVTSRGREQANSAVCMNNLRQIGAGFIMYTQENEGKYPFHADWNPPQKEDWFHWQPGVGRDPANLPKTSAISRGMGKIEPKLFRCPSDDTSNRTRWDTQRQGPVRYEYSYSMNGFFASNWNPPGPRATAVAFPSTKVLVIDEDELSVDDGHYWPDGYGGSLENFLASRHTKPRRRDFQTWMGVAQNQRKDKDERGNVLFADGHVESVTRFYTWQRKHYDPRAQN